jgi:rubrerythrin
MAEKEYIERGAALLAITNDGCTASNVGALMGVPAADVVEVVHGEWVDPEDDDGGTTWYCNKCGIPAKTNWGIPHGNYCPNCGAKMDGKDGEG